MGEVPWLSHCRTCLIHTTRWPLTCRGRHSNTTTTSTTRPTSTTATRRLLAPSGKENPSKRGQQKRGGAGKAHRFRPRFGRQDEGRARSGGRRPVRVGLVLARGQGWQNRGDEDAQWREPIGAWCQADT